MNSILSIRPNTKQINNTFLNAFNVTIIQQTLFTNAVIFVYVKIAIIRLEKITKINMYVLVVNKSPHLI